MTDRVILVTILCALLGGAASHTTAAQAVPAKANLDLSSSPTLYVVGYAHLDTEWRWEYPQVIDEYLPKTMRNNFALIEKYPHYVFNFSGANRYRFMKEFYPEEFARIKRYVAQGSWFPAGSSVEEGDVNAPSPESLFRQILYGNNWFRKEFEIASDEYMLPDCFGFPASLPTILAHAGVKGFSTQKLAWGSSAYAGGAESSERTPQGTPFNVGVWTGPDGRGVLAALNPGPYSSEILSDLSKPLSSPLPDRALTAAQQQMDLVSKESVDAERKHQFGQQEVQQFLEMRAQIGAIADEERRAELTRYQQDWAARVLNNGRVAGLFADYRYYGVGDRGGSPDEASVQRIEAIVTGGKAGLPPEDSMAYRGEPQPEWPVRSVGTGPVHVVSATADEMFKDITPEQAAKLPQYTGELELTNHSAGSLTSQAYHKYWLHKEELLADAAEKSSVAADWLGARRYPLERLNEAWMLLLGGQFHDLAAGTATPRAYEFAWNDDAIAMNQFTGVLTSATEGIAAALDTNTDGVPLVVYNALNVPRDEVVEASLETSASLPDTVSVIGPDGRSVPTQVSAGKLIFVAHAPSTGYAVYSVRRGVEATPHASELWVTLTTLENRYYHITINDDGDIASVWDKQLNKELLAEPLRLAITYDNPQQYPAWNMDWEQLHASPRAYVQGPAVVRIVEQGPARIAVEVSRETAGSKFVQTVSLATGEAGRRVEIANSIDWNTRESNLKAVFHLTASNQMATYDLGLGTIERPDAEPSKFEVPTHQWIDLTDATGIFGATILTGAKLGSDKPDHHTIRLTLLRTPGTRGGYSDQATQDLGHHDFIFGLAGHAEDWRAGQTDWLGERLDAPMMVFETAKHAGVLGREFSMLRVSSPRVRVLALKHAEQSQELIVRLAEMDGRPQRNVHIALAGPIESAREVNAQEQPVGTAELSNGELVASFTAYQPRTFAITLKPVHDSAPTTNWRAVTVPFNLSAVSASGSNSAQGMDGEGNMLSAESLPARIPFDGIEFQLGSLGNGANNALVARGETIRLPDGDYNRIYLLAAAVHGDQKAEFHVGSQAHALDIEDWSGFIGQWDDRQWKSSQRIEPGAFGPGAAPQIDHYAEMTGIVPGYLKPAELAWYADRHHDAKGKNVAYAYSYLFGYMVDLPAGTRTITLPDNSNIRIFAMTVANADPQTRRSVPSAPLIK